MEIEFNFNEKKYSLILEDTIDYKIEEILFLKERGFVDNSFHIRIIAIHNFDNKKFGGEIKINPYQYNDKNFSLNEFIKYTFKEQAKELFKK